MGFIQVDPESLQVIARLLSDYSTSLSDQVRQTQRMVVALDWNTLARDAFVENFAAVPEIAGNLACDGKSLADRLIRTAYAWEEVAKTLHPGAGPGSLSMLAPVGGITATSVFSPYYQGSPGFHGETTTTWERSFEFLTGDTKIKLSPNPEIRIGDWDLEFKEDSESWSTQLGGVRFGGKEYIKHSSIEGGPGMDYKEGDFRAGYYAGYTGYSEGYEGVVGDSDLGVAGGVEVNVLDIELLGGIHNYSGGLFYDVKLASLDATLGGNIEGRYVGVTLGVGYGISGGLKIGPESKLGWGPFSVGLKISEALGE